MHVYSVIIFSTETQKMDLNCAKTTILVISHLIKKKKRFLDFCISAPVKVKIHQKSLMHGYQFKIKAIFLSFWKLDILEIWRLRPTAKQIFSEICSDSLLSESMWGLQYNSDKKVDSMSMNVFFIFSHTVWSSIAGTCIHTLSYLINPILIRFKTEAKYLTNKVRALSVGFNLFCSLTSVI